MRHSCIQNSPMNCISQNARSPRDTLSLSMPPPLSLHRGVKFHSSYRPENLEWHSGRPIEAPEKRRLVYYQSGFTRALMCWRARLRLKKHLERVWNTQRFLSFGSMQKRENGLVWKRKKSLWLFAADWSSSKSRKMTKTKFMKTDKFICWFLLKIIRSVIDTQLNYFYSQIPENESFLVIYDLIYKKIYKKYTFLGKMVRNR